MSFFSAIAAFKEALFDALLGNKSGGSAHGKPCHGKSHHHHHPLQHGGGHRHPVAPVKGGLHPHPHAHAGNEHPVHCQPSYPLFPLSR